MLYDALAKEVLSLFFSLKLLDTSGGPRGATAGPGVEMEVVDGVAGGIMR